MQFPLLTHGTKVVTLLTVITDWSRFLCQVLCVCCWLCCVQNCDPAFYLWFSDSCFELVHTNCESVICPEVIRCGLQDIKIQTLTNQKKKQSKEKGTLHNIKNNRTTCSSIFMFCQPHQLGHPWMNHTYSCLLYTRSKRNYQNTLKKNIYKKRAHSSMQNAINSKQKQYQHLCSLTCNWKMYFQEGSPTCFLHKF